MALVRKAIRGLLLVLVLSVVTTGPAGNAQEAGGSLRVEAFDAFNGRQIPNLCYTVTAPGDPTPIEQVDGYFPIGTYDVLVEDCDGIYAPVSFEAVEIVSINSSEVWDHRFTILDAFMVMENRAVITGRIVDAYSGYPLKGVNARMYALDGTPLDWAASNDDGIYHLYAEPGVPVQIRFTDAYWRTYARQWYPFSSSGAGAETLIPRLGEHTVANAALEVDGGFYGRIVDPDDPSAPYEGCLVRAWSGGRSYLWTRTDGSFTIRRTGDVTIELGCAGGLIADPNNPSQPRVWTVTSGDSISLGTIGVDRDPAVSGRVTDQYGNPVPDASVMFFPEGAPATDYATIVTTDDMGYYVTREPLDGRYTALAFFRAYNDLNRADHVSSAWLGNTADRSQATYIDFDGDNRGGVDIVVKRGESAALNPSDIEDHGPEPLTTDMERDGATDVDPLEIATVAHTPSYMSLGTHYDPYPPPPGFRKTSYSATIIYSPEVGSAPLDLRFIHEVDQLAGDPEDLRVVWNGRLLPACSEAQPPCEAPRSVNERGDYVITVAAHAGGEASFVWGPSFLDTGTSIFMSDIEWLAEEGVTKGCSPPINDLFCPEDQVTRGQMAAFLVRFLGLTDRGDVDFADDNGSVFEADIEKLAAAGITRGCNPPTNDMFCPNDPVTREQMAAFLTRALGLPGASGIDFTDDDDSIFEDAIERLAAAGITRGCNPPTNDMFCPSATVTREQMAAFLHRADSLRP